MTASKAYLLALEQAKSELADRWDQLAAQEPNPGTGAYLRALARQVRAAMREV